jgi:hypothetical protein
MPCASYIGGLEQREAFVVNGFANFAISRPIETPFSRADGCAIAALGADMARRRSGLVDGDPGCGPRRLREAAADARLGKGATPAIATEAARLCHRQPRQPKAARATLTEWRRLKTAKIGL